MTATPGVSVVMGVYNGADKLQESAQSVLSQQGVELELIVVDDGSADATSELLNELTRADARVRVFRQEHAGLTRALVRGCAQARGQFIARQDCADLSLPGRLLAQVQAMGSHPGAALVSCGARFVGPEQEMLYEVSLGEADVTAGLLTLDVKRLRGPAHHGCTLFRREAYEQAGGYRDAFYFAQDLDLWTRLVERGRHIVVATVLYQAGFGIRSISGLHRQKQLEYAKILLECARLRRAGLSESPALERARAVTPHRGAPDNQAAALYFVGMCLRKRGDARARRYFRDALRADPLHLRSALRVLLG